jgi:hypothetical protein
VAVREYFELGFEWIFDLHVKGKRGGRACRCCSGVIR